MSDSIWTDATSYSRDERGVVEPRAWQTVIGGVRVVVHHFHGCGDLWFGSCSELNESRTPLKSISADLARDEFLKFLNAKVSRLAAAFKKATVRK